MGFLRNLKIISFVRFLGSKYLVFASLSCVFIVCLTKAMTSSNLVTVKINKKNRYKKKVITLTISILVELT